MQDTGLADRLREHTSRLHTAAEQSGIVREILLERVSLYGYALFLRNLLPAYQALERVLETPGQIPEVRCVARSELYRAQALESDLQVLYGPRWRQSLPLLVEAGDYADRITGLAERDKLVLIAHAYTRYLGDLNGGTILKRLLARSPGLEPEALAFYDFPRIADLGAYKTEYRQAFNRIVCDSADRKRITDEADIAFRLNISVSEAVMQSVAGN